MAVKAYVLITVETAKTKEVATRLRKMKDVKEANEVMGPFDLVAVLEANEFDRITDILRTEIRPIDGVRNTLTCVVMHS